MRTRLEAAAPQNELEGYRDYTGKVRYRLLPFIRGPRIHKPGFGKGRFFHNVLTRRVRRLIIYREHNSIARPIKKSYRRILFSRGAALPVA